MKDIVITVRNLLEITNDVFSEALDAKTKQRTLTNWTTRSKSGPGVKLGESMNFQSIK